MNSQDDVKLLAERLRVALEVYRARMNNAAILQAEGAKDFLEVETLAGTQFVLEVDLAFQAFQSEES